MKSLTIFILTLLSFLVFSKTVDSAILSKEACVTEFNAKGFTDASSYGFSPEASGITNAMALQKALDQTGTIIVNIPGIYKVAGTIYIGSNTSLIFGNNIFLKKVDEKGVFSHVLVNKGAKTKTYNNNIVVEGLQIIVNGMDVRKFDTAYGLRGQLAFFYVKDLRIDRFRCLDLGKEQFGIHVCTFEDILLNDIIIKGDKDGVHLGRGKRFKISNGIFQTNDDAVALNGHDYATSNPEMGWIEDGVIENCHDLADNKVPIGHFCRIVAGAWIDWRKGMEVQQSDAVVSNGRIYRVQAKPDGTKYQSLTPPTHTSGTEILDGITWGMVQEDIIYTAGVRNVVFRDIFLSKARPGFTILFENDKYSRSYYPEAEIPMQEQFLMQNVRVLHNQDVDFISIYTPIDVLTISNSSLKNNSIAFYGNRAMPEYFKTKINILGTVFNTKGKMTLVSNAVSNKQIVLKTFSNIEKRDDFFAEVVQGNGKIMVDSDLTGLKK